MEKRVVVFLVLSVALLFGWTQLQHRFFPEPVETSGPPQAAAPEPTTPVAAQAAPAGSPPSAPAAARAKEELVTIERPGLYRAVFTNWGAAPSEFTLLNPQYQLTREGNEPPTQINLIKKEAGAPPYLTWLSTAGADGERSDVDLNPEASWKLERQGADELVYSADAGDLHLEKRWSFPPTGYRLGLDLTITNRGQKPLHTHLLVSVNGYHDPNVKQGGLLSFGKRVPINEALCDHNAKLVHQSLESLLKSSVHDQGEVRWIGSGQQFFLVAAAFSGTEQRECQLAAEPNGRLLARAVFADKTIEAGKSLAIPMAAFAGPKLLQELDAVTLPGADGTPTDVRLGDAVNYTLEIVARPMLAVLKFIQRGVRNWGLAIIVITILLKLLLLYPTQQSMRSAKRMAKLKPELDAMKARFPDDKARQSQEQMALYKKHGISPLGGCLPALFQMPIYIAFYSMLSNAVELYHASFIGPISDMTAPFPALAVAAGALMFVQQLTSPQAVDPQQKQMMYMMPVMFMAFTLFLPSGLTLYILTNTLLTMLHQWWMNRYDSSSTSSPLKPARA